MEWSEFTRRLGRELAGLDRDTILIVREREESRHYVQAMREPDRLYAEAVSNNFLEGPLLLTLADEEVMSEAGWRPPADPAPRNWWTELPAYASPADHARLAEVMVTALRDVQGVRRPSDLVYESFHRHGTGLIELLDFGIETADPARIAERRSTVSVLAEALVRDEPHFTHDDGHFGMNGSAVNGSAGAFAGAGLLGAPVPDPEPAPAPAPVPPPSDLEGFLADARRRGDHAAYFDLLRGADLVLPGAGGPDEPYGLPLISIGGGTFVAVFTSPAAMSRDGGPPGPYRRTSFAELGAAWADPAWQLAVNPGLPSEVLLDAAAVARLGADRLAEAPAAPAAPPSPPPVQDVPVLRPPHGTRLWRVDVEEGRETTAVPVAVYDAIGGVWAPVRADVLPGHPPE
ncbi:hypothetical protein BTM25_48880 [Actinomadura rubteroloni]|uniref:Uncharacterized protein n=1 Tax=Actinomadura rubteroloni TaxID=1926885 RepID=A0A2P4UCB4_9ACTN|nr:hypothetical protein BTM25_48880 [Actinomadura rubteroloni]